ncbi:MAG TPA: hypothetical protein VGK58_03255, partial [Lacipirellulaceae bacterium]
MGATGFASAIPIIRECDAIVTCRHQLALELKMLECRTGAIIRKALASKALAEPVAPDAPRIELWVADTFSLFSFRAGFDFCP